MNFNDLALHLQHVDQYINTHIYNGIYFNPNLFVESVRSYLEMHQTGSRKELAITNNFNTFKVGTDQSKIALRLIASTPQLAKDIQMLSSAMVKDKIGEVKDGLPTSLTGSYVKVNNTNIDFYIYNASIFDFIPKSKLSKDTLNKYINEFKSRKQQPSDTITIKLPDKSMQQYWDYVFDLVGAFIGWCRGQWIWKYTSKNKSNTELKFNDKPNDKVDLAEFYFHVSKQHNPTMSNAIDLINQKYNIQIDTKGHNHISESVLFEAYQTNYRQDLAHSLHIDTFQVGSDPNKVSLKLILPTDNNIQNDIINLFTSIVESKIGEVQDGYQNSLITEWDTNKNEFDFHIYNKFENNLVKYILKQVPQNYQEIKDNISKGKLTIYNYTKFIIYKDDTTIDKELNELKQKFESMTKPASDTIIIDLSKPDNFKNKEAYWNYIFDVFVCFVGYIRGQWICKYINWDDDKINKNNRKDHYDQKYNDKWIDPNSKITNCLYKFMPEYHRLEFNNDPENVSQFGRFFHLKNDNYSGGILSVIDDIESHYGVEIDIHGKYHQAYLMTKDNFDLYFQKVFGKYTEPKKPENQYDDYHKKFYNKTYATDENNYDYNKNLLNKKYSNDDEYNNEDDEYLDHDEYYDDEYYKNNKYKPGLKKFKDKYSESVLSDINNNDTDDMIIIDFND